MKKKNQDMTIKDSGKREAFSTGSQRDSQIGKPTPSLTPTSTMLKLHLHFANGACKYESRNWEQGQPISQYIDSAERHLDWFKLGLVDEPHLIACIWNLVCMDWTLDMIKLGLLPEELDDRPEHMKEGNPMGVMILELVQANIEKTKGGQMKKGTIYIAGKMRGIENYNFDSFFEAGDRLKREGYNVISPAAMDLENDINPQWFPEGFDWSKEPDNIPISVFVLRDTNALCKCTHIYMLKGWKKSVGATAEHAIAKWLKLEIIYQ